MHMYYIKVLPHSLVGSELSSVAFDWLSNILILLNHLQIIGALGKNHINQITPFSIALSHKKEYLAQGGGERRVITEGITLWPSHNKGCLFQTCNLILFVLPACIWWGFRSRSTCCIETFGIWKVVPSSWRFVSQVNILW